MAAMTLQGLVGAADGFTNSFLSQTYPALASAVSTPIYLAAIIYWAVFGYKVYAGYAGVQWKDVLAKCVMTAAVFGTLNWGGLAQVLYHAFVSFMEGAAATIMAGKPTAQMVDALYSNVETVSETLQSANLYQIAMILDASLPCVTQRDTLPSGHAGRQTFLMNQVGLHIAHMSGLVQRRRQIVEAVAMIQ